MMISLANQAVQRGLNVRQTEALAKAVKEQCEEGEKQKEEAALRRADLGGRGSAPSLRYENLNCRQ